MDEEQELESPRPRPFPWMALALSAALALAAFFAILWRSSAEIAPDEVRAFLEEERPGVEDVASRVVDVLINYDAESLGEASESIPDVATGDFLDEFEQLLGQQLGEELAAAGASSEGEIVDGPNVAFASPTEAEALLTTRQTTQSRRNRQGVTFVYVMRVSLVSIDGVWKADDLEILNRQTVST